MNQERVKEKWWFWGDCKNLKQILLLLMEKFHEEIAESRLGLGFRVILSGKSRVSCTILVGESGF